MAAAAAADRGREAFAAGDYAAAAAAFEQALNANGDDLKLLSNLSAAKLAAGDAPGALRAAEHCAALGPSWSKAQLRLGDALMVTGRPEEAADAFERGLTLLQADPVATPADVAHLKARQREAASAAASAEAVRLEGELTGGAAATSRAPGGGAANAAPPTDKADAVDKMIRDAHERERDPRVRAALQRAAAALALAARPASDRSEPGALHGAGAVAAAQAALREAVALEPDCGEAWAQLGLLLAAQGAGREALGALRRSLVASPGLLAGYGLAAALAESLGEAGEPEPLLLPPAMLAPDWPDGHTGLALGRYRVGRLAMAAAVLREAARGGPEGKWTAPGRDGKLLLTLAVLASLEGHIAEPLSLLTRLATAGPGMGALFLYARAAGAAGDRSAATAALAQARHLIGRMAGPPEQALADPLALPLASEAAYLNGRLDLPGWTEHLADKLRLSQLQGVSGERFWPETYVLPAEAAAVAKALGGPGGGAQAAATAPTGPGSRRGSGTGTASAAAPPPTALYVLRRARAFGERDEPRVFRAGGADAAPRLAAASARLGGCLVQRMPPAPLLLGGKKCSLRIFLLLVPGGPRITDAAAIDLELGPPAGLTDAAAILAYLCFEAGLAVCCAKAYGPDGDASEDAARHLTLRPAPGGSGLPNLPADAGDDEEEAADSIKGGGPGSNLKGVSDPAHAPILTCGQMHPLSAAKQAAGDRWPGLWAGVRSLAADVARAAVRAVVSADGAAGDSHREDDYDRGHDPIGDPRADPAELARAHARLRLPKILALHVQPAAEPDGNLRPWLLAVDASPPLEGGTGSAPELAAGRCAAHAAWALAAAGLAACLAGGAGVAGAALGETLGVEPLPALY